MTPMSPPAWQYELNPSPYTLVAEDPESIHTIVIMLELVSHAPWVNHTTTIYGKAILISHHRKWRYFLPKICPI